MMTEMLKDGDGEFPVSVHEAAGTAPVVLFAVGSGGVPERHATLLQALVESGCTVIAPHFARLASSYPSEGELTLRARRLSRALDLFAEPSARISGVGHSIGAAVLVAMAGAQMWLGPERRADIARERRLTRLALLAPPTGFFQAPDALDAVRIPMLAWAGSADTVTPPAQSEWLAQALREQLPITLHVTDGAGHFSFMDLAPPHTVEPLPDKPAFLRQFSNEVCTFVLG
ncbi:alpha/beta hydrolase family protein [Pseudoduganella violaceinigra]|uniref:alpha/beta hydrolase family protein n=1 Tax=Pseudoduganella violaceinigra TaxID=246602 RepID=UPI0003FE1A65|nr:alpha/beta hydrolase [Pseudoduganella violaceinigra]